MRGKPNFSMMRGLCVGSIARPTSKKRWRWIIGGTWWNIFEQNELKNRYSGGLLSHGGSPSYHPVIHRIFHEINHPAIGVRARPSAWGKKPDTPNVWVPASPRPFWSTKGGGPRGAADQQVRNMGKPQENRRDNPNSHGWRPWLFWWSWGFDPKSWVTLTFGDHRISPVEPA
jgi:hypothetical protein